MKRISGHIAVTLIALALLAEPASANWRHHRHDCGWGSHHHLRCGSVKG